MRLFTKIAATLFLPLLLVNLLNAQAPSISSFAPIKGAPGTAVTITGTNFNTATTNNVVFFGATKATVNSATATSLNVTVPLGATYAPITVLNTATALQAYSNSNFMPTFSPNAGHISVGDFAAPINMAAGPLPNSHPYAVAIGDLDGDGKAEIVTGIQNDGLHDSIVVLGNSSTAGNISFNTRASFGTFYPEVITLADINGDGKLDIIVGLGQANGQTPYSIGILVNTSTGPGNISFAGQVVPQIANFRTITSIAVGDLDGDGKPEIAYASQRDNAIQVLHNASSGGTVSFPDGVLLFPGSGPYGVSIADIDGDGKPDLAVTAGGANRAVTYTNTSTIGSLSFQLMYNLGTGAGTNPQGIAVGDLDGDGKPDIAAACYNSGPVTIFRHLTTGFINNGSHTGSTGATKIVASDLDGDGKLDLAVTFGNNALVMRNQSTVGNVSLTSGTGFAVVKTAYDIAAGDLDGDGRPDLIIAEKDSNIISILRNTPVILIPSITSFTPTSAPQGTTVTIHGHNFITVSAVRFGGTAAQSYNVVDSTTITAVLATGASGDVSVTTSASTATLSGFVYCDTVLTPSVTITSSPSPICGAGVNTTFTATAINSGASPVYQWYKNNTAVGANSTTYTDNALSIGDSVWCVVTNNGICVTAQSPKSNVVRVYPNLSPTLNISVNPGTLICAGTSVLFTANATDTGAGPQYQWKKNGINVGTNSKTYTDNNLHNGDSVVCVLTVTAPCAAPVTITSTALKFTVGSGTVYPTSVSLVGKTSFCMGTPVTYTAMAVNAGTAPIYQWYKDNTPVGANAKTYIDSTLKTGDSLWVSVTSSVACVTNRVVTSNILHDTVATTYTTSASITANTTGTICYGTKVTYTATAVNGGSAPVYQWYKNNTAVGTNSKTYVDSALHDGDSIWCLVTSSVGCVTTRSPKSNVIHNTGYPMPGVTITAYPSTTLCAGSSVLLTATATNPGTNPHYQWQKNGVNVGTDANTYTDNTLATGDSVKCILTTTSPCALSAASNKLTFTTTGGTVYPTSASVSGPTTFCTGSKVTFTAMITNGGGAPVYQWYKNNTAVGTNNKTYLDSTLKNGDSIWCVIISSVGCVTNRVIKTNVMHEVVATTYTTAISISASNYIVVFAGDTMGCPHNPIKFTAAGSNGGSSPVYQWYKDNAPVGTNSTTYSDSVTNDNGDSIWCTLTSSAGCVTNRTVTSNVKKYTVLAGSVNAVINGPASVAAGATNVTYTLPAVQEETEILWTVPTGVTITSGQTSGIASYTAAGQTPTLVVNWGSQSGNITVWEYNFCAQGTDTLPVTVSGGLLGTNQKNAGAGDYIRSYPNPATSRVTIEFSSAAKAQYELQVLTTMGQVVSSKQGYTNAGNNIVSLDLSRLANATYYIRIIEKGRGVKMLKLIKAQTGGIAY